MSTIGKFAIVACALLACVIVHCLTLGNILSAQWEILGPLLAGGALATSFSGGPNMRDANLKQTLALPAAAATTVAAATGFDSEHTGISDFLALAELLISAPALAVGNLPNAATMTYNLIASATANLAAPVVIQQSVIVQTGAGGVGAAAATARARIPTNLGVSGRYLGLQIVSGGTAADSHLLNATLEMLF